VPLQVAAATTGIGGLERDRWGVLAGVVEPGSPDQAHGTLYGFVRFRCVEGRDRLTPNDFTPTSTP
jgi:hypothetical protein